MVASWRTRDKYMVPSLRREQGKRDAIALAESHERSGTRPAQSEPKIRSAPVPPTDHYFMSQSRLGHGTGRVRVLGPVPVPAPVRVEYPSSRVRVWAGTGLDG